MSADVEAKDKKRLLLARSIWKNHMLSSTSSDTVCFHSLEVLQSEKIRMLQEKFQRETTMDESRLSLQTSWRRKSRKDTQTISCFRNPATHPSRTPTTIKSCKNIEYYLWCAWSNDYLLIIAGSDDRMFFKFVATLGDGTVLLNVFGFHAALSSSAFGFFWGGLPKLGSSFALTSSKYSGNLPNVLSVTPSFGGLLGLNGAGCSTCGFVFWGGFFLGNTIPSSP